jgi:DNA-binding NtrC family response regulator
MRCYAWPGNVRELENRVRRAAVMAEASVVGVADLGLDETKIAAAREIVTLAAAEEAFRRRYIEDALVRNQGNRTKTARELGVDPRTIFRFLEKADLAKD